MTAYLSGRSFSVKTAGRRDCPSQNHWPRKCGISPVSDDGDLIVFKQLYNCTFCGARCTVDGKSVGEDK